jgi:SAM-dependent methyltransferase
MNWQLKALGHWIFDTAPRGQDVHYWFQRKVTRTLPRSTANYQTRAAAFAAHLENLRTHAPGVEQDGCALEIGAGRDLMSQFLLWSYGFNRQIVIDVSPLIRRELLNRAIEEVNRFNSSARNGYRRLPHKIEGACAAALSNAYQIDYRAPADARATGLAARSVDFITSTNTFEHIPQEEIRRILAEFRRILKPGGILSLKIDYQDHYSYSDKSITAYNFLQFDTKRWRRYSPPSHYQNRLRHPEHLSLIREAGFEILQEQTEPLTTRDLHQVKSLKLDPRFMSMRPEELAIRASTLVCR